MSPDRPGPIHFDTTRRQYTAQYTRRAEVARPAEEPKRTEQAREEMLARTIQINREAAARREAHLANTADARLANAYLERAEGSRESWANRV